MIQRVPPHDIEAEQALIEDMLIGPSIIPRVSNLVSPEDFYREAHLILFSIISELKTNDLIKIKAHLKSKGLIEKAGGETYLMELASAATTSAGWQHHCDLILDLSQRRKLITACAYSTDLSHDMTEEIGSTLSRHKESIRNIERNQSLESKTNKEAVDDAYRLIKDRSRGDSNVVGALTGLENIDKHIFGLEPKCTYYLAAERSTGKSALALNIGMNVQRLAGHVLYFTLESTSLALIFRQIAREAGIPLTRIRTGNIRDESEWEALDRVSGELSESKLLIRDASRFQSIEALYAYSETVSMDTPLSLVIIDYIQLVSSRGRFNNRHLELSHISKLFNFLAKDLNCPVMVLSQLNKEKSLKESGDIENNADNVWKLEKPGGPESLYVKLIATKGKDSGMWSTWLKFNQNKMKFSDCTKSEAAEAESEASVVEEDAKGRPSYG